MWFKVGDQNYLGKKIVRNNGFYVLVSNFKYVWHNFLSDAELLSISKTCNPLIEAPLPKLREMTLNLFDDNKNIVKELKEENNNLSLHLQSIEMNVKYEIFIILKRGENELVYDEFVLPLLLLLMEMQKKESKLIEVINEKESEIEEYKRENITSQKGAVVKHFLEDKFESKTFKTLGWNPTDLLHCITPKLNFIAKSLENENKIKLGDKDITNGYNHKIKKEVDAGISGVDNVKHSVNINPQFMRKRKKHNNIF